jgi:chromosome segregation ATPase
LQDRLSSAESDATRYREQYQSERDRGFTKLQELESERVTLRTENAILSEKLAQAKFELNDHQKRESQAVNERVIGLEAEIRALKEESRRKDTQIIELSNENIKTSNEHAKNIALVGQEKEFMRRDLQALREQMVKREGDVGDTLKVIKERDDKIKSLRSKKKQLKKEAEDLRGQLRQASYQRNTDSESLQI